MADNNSFLLGELKSHLNYRIIKKNNRLQKAKKEFEKEKLLVQSECAHHIVAHCNNRRGESVGYPMRVCCSCLLEETGSWWSSHTRWNEREFGETRLRNVPGRKIAVVGIDEFFKLTSTS